MLSFQLNHLKTQQVTDKLKMTWLEQVCTLLSTAETASSTAAAGAEAGAAALDNSVQVLFNEYHREIAPLLLTMVTIAQENGTTAALIPILSQTAVKL